MEDYEGTREGRGGDLVLAQGEMALAKDGANGNVDVIVGPYLHSLAKSDNPVIFNVDTGRFERCTPERAVQSWPVAKEGQYIILESPVKDDPGKHPEKGKIKAQELDTGKRINIPGPTTFALFPAQSTLIIDGHILRTNQYLIARVINGEAAMENWAKAVLKPQTQEVEKEKISEKLEKEKKESQKSPKAIEEVRPDEETPHLVTGQLLIIKGTEVSFYIPPTGIEVIVEQGEYIRDAVTLEQLEYCILLDEEGTKEYVYGPAVVFPKPTQSFYTDSHTRKFRAVELNELMGVYLKVIKPYEEDGEKHEEGDELFITGKEQRIYWPRVEHSVIKYGDRDMHYAVAIPKGEARYVLDRNSGEVNLIVGPKMFLPDPRGGVITRRKLPRNLVALLYPGNNEAIEYNRDFRGEDEPSQLSEVATAGLASFASDEFERKTSFTPPRTIQLDTKYDGAVRVMIWTGYAMKIVSMTGKERVVVGPETTFLEYDEVPEVFELSTGTPKSDDAIIKDVYLRVKANKVSDVVEAETLDYVRLQIPISYRVSFEGDRKKWFDIENYVRFLTDHLRSLIANTVKQYGIEEFNGDYINILRDSILGTATASKEKHPGEKRPGRGFEENGMRIYDVELGKMKIGDSEIEELLQNSQHESVRQTLSVTMDRRKLEVTEEKQEILQRTNEVEAATVYEAMAIEEETVKKQAVLNDIKLKAELEEEKAKTEIHAEGVIRLESTDSQHREHIAKMIAVEVEGIIEKAKAITPDMIEAIQVFADKELAGKLATSMGPLAILGGASVADVFNKLVAGTPLGKSIEEIMKGRIARRTKEQERQQTEDDE